MSRVKVAIVGSGPGGLSAGARAAQKGMSHIVLERAPTFAQTIQSYQKGKYVMATPDILPLRSDMIFEAGKREAVLGAWEEGIRKLGIDIRYGQSVTKVSGRKGAFRIDIANGTPIEAENVVMAIGVQGNIRKLDAPGADIPMVQYQLDDPDAYRDESIVVVGGGDSALENALALTEHNRVTVAYRGEEFARIKTGNMVALQKAIREKRITTILRASPVRVEPDLLVLKTPDGTRELLVDRIIARLGGEPPRQFLEACGVKFPADKKIGIPEVTTRYETNVPGLYGIGALAGYPLIKHCMNQGYEVIETIAESPVPPADEPLLAERLQGVPGRRNVDDALELVRTTVRLFEGLTTLQLREFLLDSSTRLLLAGETLPSRDDYGETLLVVVSGAVQIDLRPMDGKGSPRTLQVGEGDFFGDVGFIAARRRTIEVVARKDTVLIELTRRAAVKLLAIAPKARTYFEQRTIQRELEDLLGAELDAEEVAEVQRDTRIQRFARNEPLIKEGTADDRAVYFLRTGSVTVTRDIEGKSLLIAFVPAGHFVGEMALLTSAPRNATVTATIDTEAIRFEGEMLERFLARRPGLRAKIEKMIEDRGVAVVGKVQDQRRASLAELFRQHGAGEATDLLLIDESLCVRCDNCEKACAESHDGISRLNREAGPTIAMMHVPTSCRHCEQPHCMTDCPPNALHRAVTGEVWIDDTCIGCGNCVANCPYGVIQLAAPPPPRAGLLRWLMTGIGVGPGDARHGAKKKGDKGDEIKKAVKCDMCKGIEGGAACVRACPTGAAIRLSPGDFFDSVVGS